MNVFSINEKFPFSKRTFETRLLFLDDIYKHKHDNVEIMAKCIEYKLGKSLEHYADELERSYKNLYDDEENTIQVLKKSSKGAK